MGKKAWLFMSADYYPGILTQENAMKDYCIENGIEVVGSTLSVHCGLYDESAIRMAIQRATANECDLIMIQEYSLLRYSPEIYMELLNIYLEHGVSIYALDCGNVYEHIRKLMPEPLRKRLG